MLTTLAKKIFLFHINDEHLDKRSKPIYEYFNYVWRTCCSPKYFSSNKVKCIPPGYKSGFKQKFDLNKKRQFKWCFFGTQHKSSRHDMNFQLEKIKPNILFFSTGNEISNKKNIADWQIRNSNSYYIKSLSNSFLLYVLLTSSNCSFSNFNEKSIFFL